MQSKRRPKTSFTIPKGIDMNKHPTYVKEGCVACEHLRLSLISNFIHSHNTLFFEKCKHLH